MSFASENRSQNDFPHPDQTWIETMKWISKLLGKLNAQPSAPLTVPSKPPTAQINKSAEDAERLRLMLAASANHQERKQLAARLGHALAERSQAPVADDLPEVWVAAVCHAPDKALALAWVAGLADEAGLGEVAMQARSAEVRFAAAQRIETTAVLEKIAHASRDKDKRVYRHCAETLRQRREADASARRALEIATELHRLLESAPLSLSPVLALKDELSTLGATGEAGLQLMQQALARVHQESEALRDLQAQQRAAIALASEFAQAAWPGSGQIENWHSRVNALNQFRAGLPPWLAAQATAHAMGEALVEIASRLALFGADQERVLACESFLAALEAGMPVEPDTATAWQALPKPDHPAAREPLESRWQALNIPLPQAPPAVAVSEPVRPAPRPQPKIDRDAVQRLFDKLELAIEQGHLIDADSAAKQIKTTLGGNSLHGALESRLHTLQAQLETLRGWARWGTQQARDKLIAAAEELLHGEHDVDELARAIPALREEWKRLNTHAAAAKGQWESFDATLEKAYQPVAAQRAEAAARQAEARAAKEALCVDWEAELAGIVWEQADFKLVEARRAEMQKQWRALPQAGFRDERPLRKRFDTLIGSIDQQLDTARAAEIERREQLIAAAEALGEQTELGRAMTEAKALQTRWNQQPTSVRLKRSDEERVWQRFRAACNVVFERRDAQRVEQAALRQAQAQSRQNLLDAFAATLAGDDANGIKQALTQFRAEWLATGSAVSRPAATRPNARETVDGLDNRARDLQQQAQQRLDELHAEKYRARYELLAHKAALVDRIEAAALAAEPLEVVVAEAKQAWDALPHLPGKTESLLAKRFAAASSITEAALVAGREARQTLLLDLEIALGLPSPEAYVEVRRKRQLEQLQNRFGVAASQSSEAETLLARWYAMAALPDAACAQRIAAVVRLLAAQAVPGREK